MALTVSPFLNSLFITPRTSFFLLLLLLHVLLFKVKGKHTQSCSLVPHFNRFSLKFPSLYFFILLYVLSYTHLNALHLLVSSLNFNALKGFAWEQLSGAKNTFIWVSWIKKFFWDFLLKKRFLYLKIVKNYKLKFYEKIFSVKSS